MKIGRDWSYAKEHLETPEAGRGKEGLSPRPFPADNLILGFGILE